MLHVIRPFVFCLTLVGWDAFLALAFQALSASPCCIVQQIVVDRV